MRFDRVLHPEIVAGLRGPADLRKYFKDYHRQIKFVGTKPPFDVQSDSLELEKMHPSDLKILIFSKYFKMTGAPIYALSKDFTHALSKLSRNIPVDILPKRFFCYLSFPDGSLLHSGMSVSGAYVWLSRKDEMPFGTIEIKDLTPDSYYLVVALIAESQEDFSTLSTRIDARNIDEIYENIPLLGNNEGKEIQTDNSDKLDLENRRKMFRVIINSILYISSQDPEIEKLRPIREYTHSQRSKLRKNNSKLNLCELPVRLLNWSYHGRIYTTDSSFVDTHLRWQRCGEKLSKVKLIWVKEHERHYETNTSLNPIART